MLASNRSFVRSTMLMLAVGVALLAAVIAASIFLTSQNRINSDALAELRRLRTATADFLLALQEAESGQRGYLLTVDPVYRAPYDKALARLGEQRENLRNTIAPYPEYSSVMTSLDKAVDGKLAELAQTVTLVEQGKTSEALAIVRNDSGQRLMDQVRAQMSDTVAKIDARLGELAQRQLQAAEQLQWVTIGGAFAIVAVMSGAILIIFQHVRELSRAQDEVEALNSDLEQRVNERTQDLINANQEVQRFAYIVTHDLRAPLVNIMGFLSELETGLKEVSAYVMAEGGSVGENEIRAARLAIEEDLPEAVGFIRSSTRKMDSLINAILKISRDGRRKLMPERIDLQAMIDNAIANVHHQVAEAQGEVTVDVKVPALRSDRFSLDQILSNLIDNAVKYRSPHRPLVISVTAAKAGMGRIRIDVTDNGRGIAASDRERVFELFRRAGTQDKAGEGIGLAYVRSLTRNLGGEVTVESTEGQGSTFSLELPMDLDIVLKGRSE